MVNLGWVLDEIKEMIFQLIVQNGNATFAIMIITSTALGTFPEASGTISYKRVLKPPLDSQQGGFINFKTNTAAWNHNAENR